MLSVQECKKMWFRGRVSIIEIELEIDNSWSAKGTNFEDNYFKLMAHMSEIVSTINLLNRDEKFSSM